MSSIILCICAFFRWSWWFISNLYFCRQLSYFWAARRVFFAVWFPFFYHRCGLSTFLTYWRAVMVWYATIIASIVSFSPRLNRLVASWMLPALLLFSSDDFFPFCCRPSCILAYLFSQRFRWVLDSASDAVKLLLLCRDLTLSTIGVPLIAPVGPI